MHLQHIMIINKMGVASIGELQEFLISNTRFLYLFKSNYSRNTPDLKV